MVARDYASARLERERSALLVIDVQERLAPAVARSDEIIARCHLLLHAATRFAIPCFATEHCAAAIGPTIAQLRDRFARDRLLAKTHFSLADESESLAKLACTDRQHIVIAGMEAHVCVMQSALGLMARGLSVFIAADAVGSRHDVDAQAALRRLEAAGAVIGTAEMFVFEWLRDARDPTFRELLSEVKKR